MALIDDIPALVVAAPDHAELLAELPEMITERARLRRRHPSPEPNTVRAYAADWPDLIEGLGTPHPRPGHALMAKRGDVVSLYRWSLLSVRYRRIVIHRDRPRGGTQDLLGDDFCGAPGRKARGRMVTEAPTERPASNSPTPIPAGSTVHDESQRSPGRVSFPNRVTLDLDDARYQWLIDTADNSGAVGGANLLRAALDYLSTHPVVLRAIVLRAQELRRGQRAATRRRGPK
jgi:hypothetical protein